LSILSGFMFIRWGTQKLFKLKSSTRVDMLFLLFVTLLMLMLKPQVSSNVQLGILFSIATCIIFSQLVRDHFNNLRNKNSSYILLVPIALIALIFLIRAIMLFLIPQSAEQLAFIKKDEAAPMLWAYILLTLALNIIMLGSALTRLVHKIRNKAEKDYLTDMWNRRAILLHQDRIHQRWLRDNVAYSVILLDLDFFKKINDQYGHAAGDATLIQTANCLKKTLRVSDLLSRYGGEEFLLLLPVTDAKEAYVIAEKLQIALSNSPLDWQGQSIPITASFGYATIKANDSQEQLINLADKAMYQAKSTGRNNICQAIDHTEKQPD